MTQKSTDEHAGKAGTFINDTDTGTRIPIEQYVVVRQVDIVPMANKFPEKDPVKTEEK